MIPDIIHDKMTNPCVINGGINTESGTFDLEYMLTFKDVYIGKPVIQENNGAQTSDYGKSYNTCGCCTDEIRQCKGQ